METFAELIEKLVIHHLKQWAWEEEVRRDDVDAEYLVNVKKVIDKMNVRRHKLLTEIDVLFKDYVEGKRIVEIYEAFKIYKSPGRKKQ